MSSKGFIAALVPGFAALGFLFGTTSPVEAQRGTRGTPNRSGPGTFAKPSNASSKSQVIGTVTAISADGCTLTITPSGQANSAAIDLTVTGDTGISLNGVKAKALVSLSPGMQIKVYCQVGSSGTTATQIQASDKLQVAGTITAVSPAASGSTTTGTVTLTSNDGTTVTLNVNLGSGAGSTRVKLDGRVVTALASLLPGMRVEARYQVTSDGNDATFLKARSGS
jgi:hypothetical protein